MMAKKEGSGNKLGAWAFLIGVVLAVVLGALGKVEGTVVTVLVAIGLIVGLLNVKDEETTPFLFAGVSMVIVSALGGSVLGTISWVASILTALNAIFVPATIIVALKTVFGLAKN